jgi:hypothetical protein
MMALYVGVFDAGKTALIDLAFNAILKHKIGLTNNFTVS